MNKINSKLVRQCSLCERSSITHKIINSTKHGKLLCDRCRQRLDSRGVQYDLPNKGEIKVVEDGKIVCHICGYAFNKPLSHVHQVHGITEREYKLEFGLDLVKGVMSEQSENKARKRVLDNQHIIDRLIEKGKQTRFKKGHKGRTRDQVSLQTKKRLQDHIKKI